MSPDFEFLYFKKFYSIGTHNWYHEGQFVTIAKATELFQNVMRF